MTELMVQAKPRLAEVLVNQGRKARWLAANIQASESHLSRVIAGHRPLRIDQAQMVAMMTGVELTELFDVSHSTSDGHSDNGREGRDAAND